jgi:hypothetical protein
MPALGALPSITKVAGNPIVMRQIIGDAVVLTVGDGQGFICIPQEFNGMDLLAAHAWVTTVSSSGVVIVQIRNVTQAADMLTTRISIGASVFTSYAGSGSVAGIPDTANDDVATGDMVAYDVDGAGTGAKGLGVNLTFG